MSLFRIRIKISESGVARAVGTYPIPIAIPNEGDCVPESKNLVLELIECLGATPMELSALDHDAAVAKISHLPQIAA